MFVIGQSKNVINKSFKIYIYKIIFFPASTCKVDYNEDR